MAKTFLHAAVDAADIASRKMATSVVMRRESWLQSLGFSWEVQSTIEDLPFDEVNLFNEKTESLHSVEDLRTTLCCLDIYTLVPQEVSQTSVQAKTAPSRTTTGAAEGTETKVHSFLKIYHS